jgi:5,5'-dehydrodivanillate O-demethylase
MAAITNDVRDGSAGPAADWQDFAHTGPGTLAGRYLRTFWMPIHEAATLQAGRAKPIRIMSEDLTLYRGETGQAHLVAFRCAHRGTQLSTGWVEGDNLRCFYHGWAYDGNGRCVEQPAEPEPFCQRIKIKSYPVQEYLGLLWAYLGEGEPPPMWRFPEYEEEGVLIVRTRPLACNYFQNVENTVDHTHVAFVHGTGQFADAGLRDVPTVDGEETEYGIVVYGRRPSGVVRVTHFFMPTFLHLKGNPEGTSLWMDALTLRVPVDDEHHIQFNVELVHLTGEAGEAFRARRTAALAAAPPLGPIGERIIRGEMTWDDIVDRTEVVATQDYVAQVGQGIVADRTHERLGRADVLVVLLRKIWERELRALAEGRPLTRWARSATPLEATTGV